MHHKALSAADHLPALQDAPKDPRRSGWWRSSHSFFPPTIRSPNLKRTRRKVIHAVLSMSECTPFVKTSEGWAVKRGESHEILTQPSGSVLGKRGKDEEPGMLV